MKKFLSWILFLTLLLCNTPICLGEGEESNESNGSVIVIEESSEENQQITEEIFEESEPYYPDNIERIIGPDDRIRVKDPYVYPYSAIAYMDVHASCGCSWSCTGFMVNKDRLLTAAHCLVCTDHGQWADKISFYFGWRGRGYSYKYAGKWTAWVGNTYRNGTTDFAYDWGCVRLASNVGETTGWFGTRWSMSDSKYTSTWVYVAGYRGADLTYDQGYIDYVTDDNIYYQMDQISGNSGGPIFDWEYYAVGIINGANLRDNVVTTHVGHRLTSKIKQHLDDLSF